MPISRYCASWRKTAGAIAHPGTGIDWSWLLVNTFWVPGHALSLYGLAEYDALSVAVRGRLSQYEFINVMHAGLWLERVFMQRISRRPG